MNSPPDFDDAIAIRRKTTSATASAIGVIAIALLGGYMLRPLDPVRVAMVLAVACAWLLLVQQTTRLAVGERWLAREVVWWRRTRISWVDLDDLASIDLRVSFPFDDLVVTDARRRTLFLRVAEVQADDVVSRRSVRALVGASAAGVSITPHANVVLARLARLQRLA